MERAIREDMGVRRDARDGALGSVRARGLGSCAYKPRVCVYESMDGISARTALVGAL